jgi:hypothetical protein
MASVALAFRSIIIGTATTDSAKTIAASTAPLAR